MVSFETPVGKRRFSQIDNERVITDSLSVAETFNNYFCEVAQSDGDCKEMVEFVDHPSVRGLPRKLEIIVFTLSQLISAT